MSASLAPDLLFARMHALTCVRPTGADLRSRAAFWRKWAMANPDMLSVAAYQAVLDNCDEMQSESLRLDNPPAPVRLVPSLAKPTRKPVKAPAIGAQEFWSLHSLAVRSIMAAHGARWRLVAPEETIEVSVPPRLRSYVGPMGGRITWRRDWRVPAARWWPGAELPAGVEASPPPPAHPWPTGDCPLARVNAAQAEQIVRDRALAATRIADQHGLEPGYPAMLTKSEVSKERNVLKHQSFQYRQQCNQIETPVPVYRPSNQWSTS